MKILLAAILLGSSSACSQPKALEYRELRHFRIQKMDLQQVTIVLDLQFFNPNNYALSLKNGELDTYVDGTYLGKAILDERTAIPANDTFLLPISVTAGLQSIFSNALDLLANPDKEVLLRLDGTVRAGKGRIFISVPVHYEGRQVIRL